MSQTMSFDGKQGTHTPFIHEADDLTFETEVIQRSLKVPVLVDCWADWCEPCKVLGPTLERLTAQYKGRFELVKVNIEQAQRVAMALRVQSVPFMILFFNGRPVDALVGNQSESDLCAFLDRHLPPDEGDIYELGLEALRNGDYHSAVNAFQQALLQDANRVEIRLSMARATLALGDLEAAGQLLDTIPVESNEHQSAQRLKSLFKLAEFQADPTMLKAQIALDQRNVDAWYRLGVTHALRGHFDLACEAFLKVVSFDRTYRDDAGKQALLLIFEVLGGEGDLVSQTRRTLASLLF
jgi:putative thioredoxin